jgi:hypothetical protein
LYKLPLLPLSARFILFLPAFCPLSSRFLLTSIYLRFSPLPAFCPHFARFLLAFCPLSIRLLPAFYQLSTRFLPLLRAFVYFYPLLIT